MPQSDHPQPVEKPVEETVSTHEIGNRTYVVAQVDPLDVDGTWTVAVGSVIFLVAFVALLPFYGDLERAGNAWWVWSCLAGFGLGVVGWDYCRRRARQRQASPPAAPAGPAQRATRPVDEVRRRS